MGEEDDIQRYYMCVMYVENMVRPALFLMAMNRDRYVHRSCKRLC